MHELQGPGEPREEARVTLPTPYGVFEARAFDCSGYTYLALILGGVGDGRHVLARVHSECLTGDALGSLRCDCGIQLRESLQAIAAEGRGVLVYATGHEGRGIGLVNKLRAYVEQEQGIDTVDANLHLGLPVDARDYSAAASVLAAVGVESVILMTNNPRKVDALRRFGIPVVAVRAVPVAPHARNVSYLRTKQRRLGHQAAVGDAPRGVAVRPPDVGELLGPIRRRSTRPYVILKYAQSLDGRIATASGDSKWISSAAEREVSHALRARCDAILIGVGTVLNDDPQLTVRLVAGASPLRVILDSTLRIPLDAQVLDGTAPTTVVTTDKADPVKVAALRARNVGVRVVSSGSEGTDVSAALRVLAESGIGSVLVEGGARVITSLLSARLVDRVIVGVAPLVLGRGIEGVGDLGVATVSQGVALNNRAVHLAGDDVLVAWDVATNGY